MANSRVLTACVEGSEVLEVTVEVDVQPGLPLFTIIGLPDKRIDEARERVRAAIKNSGFQFPLGKITVNLAPSAVRKHGTGFDLAIALGILRVDTGKAWVLGELGLQGETRACPQLASILIAAQSRGNSVVMPAVQAKIAELVGVRYAVVTSLNQGLQPVWNQGRGRYAAPIMSRKEYGIDAILGQEQAKRALIIALAGKHHLVITGPPGVGKTLLAQAALELLPPLQREELLEVLQVYGFADQAASGRPFRAPSHRVSAAALFGGGTPLKPGEASLAHRGILFLDELPLYSRAVLDGFRDILSNREVVHSRGGKRYHFPANFILIAARNLCACGKTGIEGQECHCSAADRTHYTARVSEAFLDRCTLFCDVPMMRAKEWNEDTKKEGALYAARIAKTWQENREVNWSIEAQQALEKGITSFHLSGRGRAGVQAVAGTIARLEDREEVVTSDVHEALQYRRRPGA